MISVLRDFDKVKDMQEVDQFGYVNLGEAYANGVVQGNLNPDVSEFNGIEHPESIIGKPSDEFDAIAMTKTVRERGVKQPETTPAPSDAE